MNKLSASSNVIDTFCEYWIRTIDRRQLLQKDANAMITWNGRKVTWKNYLIIEYRDGLDGLALVLCFA